MNYLFILLCVIFSIININDCYRAVTIINPPFVQKNREEQLEGFCIDMINEISNLTGYDYNIYVSPNGYGYSFYGRWTGMVGELVKKHADIAVADLTINSERQKVVDFTVPFFSSGISTLLLRSQADKIKSWYDLVNQTEISYGMLENGPTRRIFQASNDTLMRQMWDRIRSNSSNFVKSYTDAIRRITAGKYIFIGASSYIEFISGHRCDDLTHFDSPLPHDRAYGIAILKHHYTDLLQSFNFAINEMKLSGKIDHFKQKWWKSKCRGR